MSESTVKVRVDGAGKLYRRVHEKPMLLREALLLMAGRPRRYDDHWALRDVSFEMREGETVGVLGANGSGKSTLLQLVAGTHYPSEGSVSTFGRVSTLLALGAGLNGDMTGEENILLSASLLGLSVVEIEHLTPAIIAFAELEDVIDSPVRHYSSGMQARLGFSIAINISPEIIVIDEVLSVGDARFQAKCMREIQRLKGLGATLLYATQSAGQVAEFCSRALWLERGRIKQIGLARDVASAYAMAMV